MKHLKSYAAGSIILILIIVLMLWLNRDDESPQSMPLVKQHVEVVPVDEFDSFTQLNTLPLHEMPKRKAWQKTAPYVSVISIPRKKGRPQPALWYHSGTAAKKPLLVVLHSWSADYLQRDGIPYGVFAKKNDWIFIHPDYGGRFDDKEAAASQKSVEDVLDAIEYARKNAPVDEARVYLAGFSGGAMMSLVMAGRYPGLFAAALAWVPVYDLHDWYAELRKSRHDYTRKYRRDIETICGGVPDRQSNAKKACARRSPSTYLANARGSQMRVFVGGGIRDPFVRPSHAIRAFNHLADEADRINSADFQIIDKTKMIPAHLKSHTALEESRWFEKAGTSVILMRSSGNATLILFDGGHDLIYNAGLLWLAKQRR